MPPILGHLIVIAAVAALVFACGRYLYLDHRRGGGCAGCGGSCGGHCAGCKSCGQEADYGPLPDVSDLRLPRRDGPPPS